MTAAPAQQPVAVKGHAPIRKRRRRSSASCASYDCFTCSERQVQCDRRRPYCSQCLDLGNKCSGYKTELTWGLGIASRGKFRGLSLPLVKDSTPYEPNIPLNSPGRAASTTTSSLACHGSEPEDRHCDREAIDGASLNQHSFTADTPYTGGRHDCMFISHPAASQAPSSYSWNGPQYPPPSHNVFYSTAESTFRFLPPIITNRLPPSIDTVNHYDYISPISQADSEENIHLNSTANMLHYSDPDRQFSPATCSLPQSLVINTNAVHISFPSLVHASPDLDLPRQSSHVDSFEAHLVQHQQHKQMRDCDSLGEYCDILHLLVLF